MPDHRITGLDIHGSDIRVSGLPMEFKFARARVPSQPMTTGDDRQCASFLRVRRQGVVHVGDLGISGKGRGHAIAVVAVESKRLTPWTFKMRSDARKMAALAKQIGN